MTIEKLNSRRGRIRNVFVFLLLCLFAVSGMLVIVAGAGNYRTMVAKTEANQNERIIDAVIRNAVRTGDTEGAIQIEEIPGTSGNTLRIAETDADGETVYKRLFCRDGQLVESYTSGEEFNGNAGETICMLDSFFADFQDGILSVHLMNGDNERLIRIAPYTHIGGDFR